MTDDKWLGYHALDGENEEWTHFEVWKGTKDTKVQFYWNFIDENDWTRQGPVSGPFDTAWEAFNDANN